MTYFELFDIPVSFLPDQNMIKEKFYQLSRKYHPDFYSQSGEDEQSEALEKSSMVNKAYKTFQNPDEIIKYVLQLKELLEEEEKFQLPPEFLMNVMELNEELTDAKMDSDASKMNKVKSAITNLQTEIYAPVKEIIENYKDDTASEGALLQVKEYYFQKKYLNRILAGIR